MVDTVVPPDPAPRRRHRAVAAAAAGVVVIAVATVVMGACGLDRGTRASIETPSSAPPSENVAATAAAESTAPTTAVNDLLAPPPTVRPDLDTDDGMAPLVRRVDTTDRVIFITIDDGQIRDPAVLDQMTQMGLPFTSFLTQPYATAAPDFWKGTQAAWGIVETHTITHPDLREVSEAAQRKEICRPADTFEELFGRRPTLFRPPYGNSSDSVRRIAKECGYDAVVLWTGSTNNGRLTMQQIDLQPGDIILMHYRDTLGADLADVLARARAEGFTIGRLQDYLSPGR